VIGAVEIAWPLRAVNLFCDTGKKMSMTFSLPLQCRAAPCVKIRIVCERCVASTMWCCGVVLMPHSLRSVKRYPRIPSKYSSRDK
jgi:hypothetical protein